MAFASYQSGAHDLPRIVDATSLIKSSSCSWVNECIEIGHHAVAVQESVIARGTTAGGYANYLTDSVDAVTGASNACQAAARLSVRILSSFSTTA